MQISRPILPNNHTKVHKWETLGYAPKFTKFLHDVAASLPLLTRLCSRVAVDMKYHIHIHIHIHIHRCLSCVDVYAVSNYKKHSYFLLSTGSIFTAFMTKHKMKKHTQVRSVLCYRVSVQKKNHKTVTDSFQHSVLIRHFSVISVSSILFNSLLQILLTDSNSQTFHPVSILFLVPDADQLFQLYFGQHSLSLLCE